MEIIKDI